jgi:hypothetical protein
MIRSFGVCRKEWDVVGNLGMETLALQSTASDGLGVSVTCGDEATLANFIIPLCFVSRWKYMTVSNPQFLSADMITKKGTVAVA